ARVHRRLGLTMLYVTHDQMEAMTLGHRIAVMKDGALKEVAEPIRLYQRPGDRFVAGFFGSPPMNFFHGEIRRNGSGVFFQEQPPYPRREGVSAGETPAALFTLRLEGYLNGTMQAYIGKQILLGI